MEINDLKYLYRAFSLNPKRHNRQRTGRPKNKLSFLHGRKNDGGLMLNTSAILQNPHEGKHILSTLVDQNPDLTQSQFTCEVKQTVKFS